MSQEKNAINGTLQVKLVLLKNQLLLKIEMDNEICGLEGRLLPPKHQFRMVRGGSSFSEETQIACLHPNTPLLYSVGFLKNELVASSCFDS